MDDRNENQNGETSVNAHENDAAEPTNGGENSGGKKTDENNMVFGMCIGMCIGMSLGSLVFDNLALGMCFGMSIGMAIGLAIKKK